MDTGRMIKAVVLLACLATQCMGQGSTTATLSTNDVVQFTGESATASDRTSAHFSGRDTTVTGFSTIAKTATILDGSTTITFLPSSSDFVSTTQTTMNDVEGSGGQASATMSLESTANGNMETSGESETTTESSGLELSTTTVTVISTATSLDMLDFEGSAMTSGDATVFETTTSQSSTIAEMTSSTLPMVEASTVGPDPSSLIMFRFTSSESTAVSDSVIAKSLALTLSDLAVASSPSRKKRAVSETEGNITVTVINSVILDNITNEVEANFTVSESNRTLPAAEVESRLKGSSANDSLISNFALQNVTVNITLSARAVSEDSASTTTPIATTISDATNTANASTAPTQYNVYFRFELQARLNESRSLEESVADTLAKSYLEFNCADEPCSTRRKRATSFASSKNSANATYNVTVLNVFNSTTTGNLHEATYTLRYNETMIDAERAFEWINGTDNYASIILFAKDSGEINITDLEFSRSAIFSPTVTATTVLTDATSTLTDETTTGSSTATTPTDTTSASTETTTVMTTTSAMADETTIGASTTTTPTDTTSASTETTTVMTTTSAITDETTIGASTTTTPFDTTSASTETTTVMTTTSSVADETTIGASTTTTPTDTTSASTKITAVMTTTSAMTDETTAGALTATTPTDTDPTTDASTETIVVPTGLAWYLIVIIVLGVVCIILLVIIVVLCYRRCCVKPDNSTSGTVIKDTYPPPASRPQTPTERRPPPVVPTPEPARLKIVDETISEDGPDAPPSLRITPVLRAVVPREQPVLLDSAPSLKMSQDPFVPKFKSTIHPIVLPPINAVVPRNVGESLSDEAMIRQRQSIERHKNKVRLRKRQPRRLGPYGDAESEIDKVLTPSTPAIIRGRRRFRRGRDSATLDRYEDPEIAMLMGRRRDLPGSYFRDDDSVSSTDSGVTSPETTRRKIQSLLDDAFSLISPSAQRNLVGPTPPTQVRPSPMTPGFRSLMHHPDGRTSSPHHRVINPAAGSPNSANGALFTRRQLRVPPALQPSDGYAPHVNQSPNGQPTFAYSPNQHPGADHSNSPVWTPYRTYDALSHVQAQGNANHNNSNHAAPLSTSSPLPGSVHAPRDLDGTYIPPPSGFQTHPTVQPSNTSSGFGPTPQPGTAEPGLSIIQSVKEELSRMMGNSTPVENLMKPSAKKDD